MDRLATLLDLERRSRILRGWYPEARDRLAHARLLLRDYRDLPPEDATVRDARFLYASAAKSCAECWHLLHELAGLVAVLLPGLWSELRLVGSGRPWHELPGFDWPGAETELRRIEAAALAAVVAEGDGGEATAAAPAALGEKPQTVNAEEVGRLLCLAGDGTGVQVLSIARDETKTADERMRTLVEVDRRYEGFNSTQWADLLGVKPPAVRQTVFWRKREKRRKQS